jgi:hypothetical protein
LESLLKEIEKLKTIRDLGLPADILGSFHPDLVKRFRRRAATESSWELRRHPDDIRLPLLVFYCMQREAEIVDGLVDLLLQITHRITVRAERRIVQDLLDDFQQVQGKTLILFRIAAAALGNPDGTMRDVIFPVVDETVCETLVKEQSAGGANHNWMAGLFDDAPVHDTVTAQQIRETSMADRDLEAVRRAIEQHDNFAFPLDAVSLDAGDGPMSMADRAAFGMENVTQDLEVATRVASGAGVYRDRRGSLWVAHDNSHAQQDEYLMEYVGNLDDLNVPLKD